MADAYPDTGQLWRREGMAGGAVCFGGTGVQVEFVAGRFAAGETIAELADDYALDERTIEAGLRAVVHGAFKHWGGLRTPVRRVMEERIPLLRKVSA